MERSYPVVLVPQDEGGFFAQCPALPGCYSQGETFERALASISESISLTLEDMAAQGEPVPASFDCLLTHVRVAG